MLNDGTEWSFTGVYGPQQEADKLFFLEELKSLKQNAQDKWLLSGDFNLIYKAEDKSNVRVNRRMMGEIQSNLRCS